MAIIECELLTKKFKDLIAVNRISFGVEANEVFGLLGPNGAGKTTTIKMLNTLLEPTSGRAYVAGFDVVKNPADVRRSIGYVPQLISADGALTGYENLLIFSKLYDIPARERKERIHHALEFMGLGDVVHKIVKQYSGGMIRRLEIAQSMLHRPKVLFLDEPTLGLDPVARQAVWGYIVRLKDDFGTTVFLTTHFMEEADSLCGKVAIMHYGKIVAMGTPAELKSTIGRENATLNDVFIHYTGDNLDSGGSYRDTTRTRRTARRLG